MWQKVKITHVICHVTKHSKTYKLFPLSVSCHYNSQQALSKYTTGDHTIAINTKENVNQFSRDSRLPRNLDKTSDLSNALNLELIKSPPFKMHHLKGILPGQNGTISWQHRFRKRVGMFTADVA